MRFKTRMVFMYAILMIIMALVLGLGFYKYSERQYEKSAEQNLKVAANQLIEQFDEMINMMQLTMNYILSDPNMLSGIRTLARNPEHEDSNRYIEEAQLYIRNGINTDYITKHFYRTIVFNRSGSVISTQSSNMGTARTDIQVVTMPWLNRADAEKGKPIIVNTHKDNWINQGNVLIFSLVKAIQGINMGYIEVQRSTQDLKDELKLSKDSLKLMIFVNGNELLYTNKKVTDFKQYKELVNKEGTFVRNIKTTDKETLLVAKGTSKYHNVNVLVIEDRNDIKEENAYITSMTFGIASSFFVISMAFVFILSQFLTKPIRQLKTIMENTKMENIGDEVFLNTPNDEIEALRISYHNVLERLNKSIIKEKRSSLLQIQAQFDSLQAQVNPHFLYNVLNVIAARGMTIGEESICEMCGSLAMMLRYSTNNKNRYATIGDELEYLNQYFYLLKSRYEHKIEFYVEVANDIKNQIIPKIVFQQIVENSINHGFKNIVDTMKINIIGWEEAGYWYIKIQDNGQGFEENTLQELIESLAKVKERLTKEESNMELEIGGMGLSNTYARLFILYNQDLSFEIHNIKDGAEVVVRAKLTTDIQKLV